MKKLKKRLLALGLAMTMVATALPQMQLFAGEQEQKEDTTEQKGDGYQGPVRVDIDFNHLDSVAGQEENQTSGYQKRSYRSDARQEQWKRYSSDYYYTQLSAAQKQAWDQLDEECMDILLNTDSSYLQYNSRNDMYLLKPVTANGLTSNQAMQVIELFTYSNPQYYFLSNYFSDAPSQMTIILYTPFGNGQTRSMVTEHFASMLQKWTKDLDTTFPNYDEAADAESQFDMEVEIHDLICDEISYDFKYTDEWYNQSIISVLFDHYGVCAGYAKSMTALLSYYGITNCVVFSSGHVWNEVEIGENWYVLDATWDDSNGDTYINRTYLNTTNEKLNDSTHTEDAYPEYLPASLVPKARGEWSAAEERRMAAPKFRTGGPLDDITVLINASSGRHTQPGLDESSDRVYYGLAPDSYTRKPEQENLTLCTGEVAYDISAGQKLFAMTRSSNEKYKDSRIVCLDDRYLLGRSLLYFFNYGYEYRRSDRFMEVSLTTSEFEIPTPAKKTGYEFLGWGTSNTDPGDLFLPEDLNAEFASLLADDPASLPCMEFVAEWQAKEYTISFDPNGGTLATASRSRQCEYDTALSELPTPTRTGYTFLGWYTAKSGGTKVSVDTLVTGAATYYAHWKVNSYKLQFNGNGGKSSSASKTVTYLAKYGTLPKATRAGYTFLGWYTAKTGGTKVTANSVVKITKTTTLYAHWQKVTVAKGTIAKVVNKATRKAVVTIKSVSGAKGYQIRYATVSNMKGAKTVTLSASTLSRTFKSLKKGKTYYFQVRAYKTDSTGKKIYGSWSAKKSVKIKK